GPACGGNHARRGGKDQHQGGTQATQRGAEETLADHIGTHETADFVQVIVAELCLAVGEHMNLRSDHSAVLQIHFQLFQSPQFTAAKEVSFHRLILVVVILDYRLWSSFGPWLDLPRGFLYPFTSRYWRLDGIYWSKQGATMTDSHREFRRSGHACGIQQGRSP